MTHFQGDSCPGGHYPKLALSGWMRSGKDSIASHLVDQYDYTRGSFADILKTEVAKAVGCTLEEMNEEPLRTQIRPVLQAWGTDFRRVQDPDYWVKLAVAGLLDLGAAYPVVFTDCRFTNELNALKDLGFVTVKVDMAEDEVRRYLTSQGRDAIEIDRLLAHRSEREWQEYDFDHIVRSVMGDLKGLFAQIDGVVRANPL